MQSSPIRKSSRLQAAASQSNSGPTSADIALIPENMAQPVSSQTQVETTTTTVMSAATKTATGAPPENVFISDVEQNLPLLVPGPSVRFQSAQATSAVNVRANVRTLQQQIENLKTQLFEAQRVIKEAERANMMNIQRNTSVSDTPSMSGNNFDTEDTLERHNQTPYSTAFPNHHSQQQLLTTQPINMQPVVPSIPMQRKIYDLPEFYGSPEDWPMFLSAFEHSTASYAYNHFENCLRLQKALKGEARECVKSLLIHPNNVPAAIDQLKVQYGRPEVLIRSQLQQIKEIQPIGENAVDKLVPYSIKVRNLAAFLETGNGQQHLANPTLMEELVQKLPMSKRLDWAQFASNLQQWPTVLDFSTWLQRIANLVRSIQTSNSATSRPASDQKRKVVLHAADDQSKHSCPMCQANHKLVDCRKFAALNVANRWSEVKRLKLCFTCLGTGHSSRFCRVRKPCSVNGCCRKHNKLLHDEKIDVISPESVSTSGSRIDRDSVLSCISKAENKGVLLFRVVPIILYGPCNKIETYALLDEGSSVTMMDSSLVKQLGLQGQQTNLNLNWYAGEAAQEMATVVNMHVSGIRSRRKYALRNVYGVSNLKLPTQSFNMDLSAYPGLPIKLYNDVVPKVLIGLDHCHLGLPDEIVALEENGPYAANTPLGWVVFGQTKGKSTNSFLCLLSVQPEKILHDMVENYFESENFGIKALPVIESKDEVRARQIMSESTFKVDGRFQTRLLWRSDDVVLPDSYSMALNRLKSMERKFKRNPNFGAAYKCIMKDYLCKGYARKLSPIEAADVCHRTWYLPHFGVVNPNKPEKIRLVFDAAASVEGISLNTNLLKGPQQYKPLPSVLFNFRIGTIAVCGDIKEMFHQVLVAPEDRCSQRFLWREDEKNSPDSYEMLVMTFGAACSPCIAHYIKNMNAATYRDQYPRAVKSIVDHHYVDDFVDSFSTAEKAIEVTLQVREIHDAAGFELRNFSSNSFEVIKALRGSVNVSTNFFNDVNELHSEKILGMYWQPKDDVFKFNLKFHNVNAEVLEGIKYPTKRELLCVVMSVFDPLGFLSNYMIAAKLLMREVWRHGLLWDEKLPTSLKEMWNNWRQQLKNVVRVEVPRHYFKKGLPAYPELHIFVDASEDAFGAVAYWRYITSDDSIVVSFIAAKTKCAPLKSMTIPRLELQAAVLGTRLMCTILKEHEIGIARRICWSDSTTVISWIQSECRRYKPFVAHRITEILDSTRPEDWRWLSTNLNVADETTKIRGKINFSNESRWFKGPQFLYKQEDDWPKYNRPKIALKCDEELRPKFTLLVSKKLIIDFNRFSSFLRLIRTMAWVLRFINCCKTRVKSDRPGFLSTEELKVSETGLWRISQQESFAYESEILKSGGTLKRDNDLYTLSPYFDEDKLLRVSGRIDAASWLPLNVKRPIILAPSHRLTQLFVAHIHNKMKHQNFEATVGEIRRKIWVPRLRSLLRKTVRNCYLCKLLHAVPVPPFMGSLPSDRLTPYVRPFTFTGVDYFGPVNVTVGRRHEKRWVALFTCLTIRAVHLEVAYDLSTDACILAIRNFINRRGTPSKMRSDNGKNFVGANEEAKRFEEVFDVGKIQDEMSTKGIVWEFNCPYNPAEGGIWERMVQSVKRILRVTLKEIAPKEHTLRSFLIEAENILNSRPLTHLPVSHEDEEPLTPNHFLLGSANTAQTPEGTEIMRPVIMKKQWRIARQLRDHFWKRWITEYLPTLTRRSKWCERTKPITVGELVLVCDPAVSRRDWRRGRVVRLYPGVDGIARRADIQTSSGILKRPVSKLAVLDLDSGS